jgi:hypothetical protein
MVELANDLLLLATLMSTSLSPPDRGSFRATIEVVMIVPAVTDLEAGKPALGSSRSLNTFVLLGLGALVGELAALRGDPSFRGDRPGVRTALGVLLDTTAGSGSPRSRARIASRCSVRGSSVG